MFDANGVATLKERSMAVVLKWQHTYLMITHRMLNDLSDLRRFRMIYSAVRSSIAETRM